MARADIQDLEHWRRLAEESAYHAGRLATGWRVSRRQLERWTQQLFGRSPHDWLQEQRFLRAARELKAQRCVKVVSADLGFKQVSHFSREFKRHHGLSPAAYLAWNDQHTPSETDRNSFFADF